MVIIWGSRLYGRVDDVKGLFYVATKCGHLRYIPLLPMESYLVLETSLTGWRGVPIPMSGKSVLMAWARAGAFIGAVVTGIGVFAVATAHNANGVTLSSILT